MMRKYFGTDGIRGQANRFPMTAELALKVGMAAGLVFKNGGHRHRVVIGKDTRLSGYMLETALVAGFTSVGMDVFLLGPMPTPSVAMLTRSLRTDLGVMISASHNPFQDNGIKFFGPDGFKLSDEIEKTIEGLVESDLTSRLAGARELGRARRIDGAQQRYIEFAKRTLPREMNLEGLRVVVDCANGAAYKVAPEALWELGADVISMGVTPDGFNINQDCGSTSTDALSRKVHEVRADIGIALDGDADRVIIVDENGAVVDGDQLMAVVAQSWQASNRLSAQGIVATVMSNLGLERYLQQLGLGLARTKVGDRYVVEHMRANGYNVGGEQSGHIVLSDFTTTGDGLIAALQVLACVKDQDRPVSEVCRRFEPVPQILKNVRYKGGAPLEQDKVKSAIEDGEARLGKSGRLVIRASGTEPLIRVMAEGDDADLVKQVVNDIAGVVAASAA
ncbi:phosphoglucosamine mutase [Roseibium sp. Sym1]|uniref:phosphoglucosamine mutase n=1 Tax=Roseibium sp. Sym1 TaxID=3016006 RepID=UPI0022B58B48|nr:phosphoglucosamine mutase [Roseibium sp. Sym1]